VILFLLTTICVPALLFVAEAALVEQSELKKLRFSYNRAWAKIFSTYDVNIKKSCQYFCGYIPLDIFICKLT